MADLNGKPLVQYAIEATSGLFARRVVVTRSDKVAKLCQALGVHAVLHTEPKRSDTVRLGMNKLGNCATAMFVQGDQPLISIETIAALLRSAEDDPASIWRTSFHGTPGAPMLFPSWAFDELRALPCGKGGSFVAKAHAEKVRTVEVASKWELFDVDTREDLLSLQQSRLIGE